MKHTFVKSEDIEPEEEEDKRKHFVYSGSLLRTSPQPKDNPSKTKARPSTSNRYGRNQAKSHNLRTM